ncbi:MAG: hypothetical protein J7K29_07170 [Candidatus Cloacimonetes bacterium]|nr:hypothetical protein [Candidatus Cloacimonadota bacterium]
MAEIRITISEIIDICIANNLIPDSISNIVILGESIKFRYKNVHPIPVNVDLEIKTNWIIDKYLHFKKLPSIQYLQYEHPTITFFLEQFLIDKTKIMHIENIHFNNGYFKIKTFNE